MDTCKDCGKESGTMYYIGGHAWACPACFEKRLKAAKRAKRKAGKGERK